MRHNHPHASAHALVTEHAQGTPPPVSLASAATLRRGAALPRRGRGAGGSARRAGAARRPRRAPQAAPARARAAACAHRGPRGAAGTVPQGATTLTRGGRVVVARGLRRLLRAAGEVAAQGRSPIRMRSSRRPGCPGASPRHPGAAAPAGAAGSCAGDRGRSLARATASPHPCSEDDLHVHARGVLHSSGFSQSPIPSAKLGRRTSCRSAYSLPAVADGPAEAPGEAHAIAHT